ncbi:unnamed protein product, partial [marine sediment metagenome]
MRVDFQIVHSYNSSDDVKSKLLSLLKETLADEYIETTDEEIEEWIQIKYNHPSNDKFITGFSLFLDKEENTNGIIIGFSKKLHDSDDIYLVLKFFDENMSGKFKSYAEEIFEIEMALRHVLSFIFIDTYRDDYFNLLKEIKVKLQRFNGKNIPRENHYKAHLENEFFFLLFSDYTKLDKLKEIEQPDLIEAISESDNYDTFRRKVLNRGIVDEKYRKFLAEIKENLQAMENLRNCIAHNGS